MSIRSQTISPTDRVPSYQLAQQSPPRRSRSESSCTSMTGYQAVSEGTWRRLISAPFLLRSSLDWRSAVLFASLSLSFSLSLSLLSLSSSSLSLFFFSLSHSLPISLSLSLSLSHSLSLSLSFFSLSFFLSLLSCAFMSCVRLWRLCVAGLCIAYCAYRLMCMAGAY